MEETEPQPEEVKALMPFYESIRTRLGKFKTTVSLSPTLDYSHSSYQQLMVKLHLQCQNYNSSSVNIHVDSDLQEGEPVRDFSYMNMVETSHIRTCIYLDKKIKNP